MTTMKAIYSVSGGRGGGWINFWCSRCGVYLGNSDQNSALVHPATKSSGFFFNRRKVPIVCVHVGKRFAVPRFEVALTELALSGEPQAKEQQP